MYNGVTEVLSVPSGAGVVSISVDAPASGSIIMVDGDVSGQSSIAVVGRIDNPGAVVVGPVGREAALIVGEIDRDQAPDLDAMTHPLFGITRKIFENGPSGITKISVLSGITDGITLFERTMSYDQMGRVFLITTDCPLSKLRLIKTIVYDEYGDIENIKREMTTWQ